jgi:hypothetical protein
MSLDKNFFAVLLIFALAACSDKPLPVHSQLCKAVIEDLFTEQFKLSIDGANQNSANGEILAAVDYSITDVTGKRVHDTAICAFDEAAVDPVIKSIVQFDKMVPAPHVQFLNIRAHKKLALDAASPASENAVPTAKSDVPSPVDDQKNKPE